MPARSFPDPKKLLRWHYVARLSVASALYLAVLFKFQIASPTDVLLVSVGLLLSILVTGWSFWVTHLRRQDVGIAFHQAQALFDTVLVTLVVHVTGGSGSNFFPLYLVVIAGAALTLPAASTLLITFFASLLYFSDVVWGHQALFGSATWLQLAVFVVVSVPAAYLGQRVRTMTEEARLLERELSLARLEATDVLNQISSGILTVNRQGALLYMNPSAERILGFSVGSWISRNIMGELARLSPEFWAAIQATIRDGILLSRAEATVYRTERAFPVGLTTTAVGDLKTDGEYVVTAIFSDISEQKRLEEMRLRTERLEAIANLSASLAHEIKNPLASIRSSVEQLARFAGDNEDERELSSLIVRESDRLSRLLSEFLDFSRVHVTNVRPVNLLRVADAAVRLVREHPACGKSADISVEGDAETVEGDEDLLHRIIWNLVLNAVQVSNGSARVTVSVRRVEDDALPAGANLFQPVEIVVADTGPGIPAEEQARIFEPFVTGRPGGSGLGLAVVQRAVQAHRGLVIVDSAPGEGTTFRVLLPSVRPSRDDS